MDLWCLDYLGQYRQFDIPSHGILGIIWKWDIDKIKS